MKNYSTKTQTHRANSFSVHLKNTIDRVIRSGNTNSTMSIVFMEPLKNQKRSTINQGKMQLLPKRLNTLGETIMVLKVKI